MATIGLLLFDQFGGGSEFGKPPSISSISNEPKRTQRCEVTVPLEVSQFNTSRLLFEMATAAR